jgi:acyl carrier protein
MADSKDVEQTARQVICNMLGKKPEQVTMDSLLVADLDMQSIDFIELYESLDQEFNVDIDDEANQIQTFGDLVRYIQSRLESSSSEAAGA